MRYKNIEIKYKHFHIFNIVDEKALSKKTMFAFSQMFFLFWRFSDSGALLNIIFSSARSLSKERMISDLFSDVIHFL